MITLFTIRIKQEKITAFSNRTHTYFFRTHPHLCERLEKLDSYGLHLQFMYFFKLSMDRKQLTEYNVLKKKKKKKFKQYCTRLYCT